MLKSLFGLRQQASHGDRKPISQVTAKELHTMLKNDKSIVVVDVRTPREFEFDGHIAGSILLPLQALRQRIDELPKDKTVVCVCRSGSRSQSACGMLSQQGFSDIVNLRGGMIGWKISKLPMK